MRALTALTSAQAQAPLRLSQGVQGVRSIFGLGRAPCLLHRRNIRSVATRSYSAQSYPKTDGFVDTTPEASRESDTTLPTPDYGPLAKLSTLAVTSLVELAATGGLLWAPLACALVFGLLAPSAAAARQREAEAVRQAEARVRAEMSRLTPVTLPETAEWMNRMMGELWAPYVEPMVLRENLANLQDKVQRSAPPGFTVELEHLSMGRQASRMSNFQAFTDTSTGRLAAINCDMTLDSDSMRVVVRGSGPFGTFTANISGITMTGPVRLTPIPEQRLILFSFREAPDMSIKISVKAPVLGQQKVPQLSFIKAAMAASIQDSLVEPRRAAISLDAEAVVGQPLDATFNVLVERIEGLQPPRTALAAAKRSATASTAATAALAAGEEVQDATAAASMDDTHGSSSSSASAAGSRPAGPGTTAAVPVSLPSQPPQAALPPSSPTGRPSTRRLQVTITNMDTKLSRSTPVVTWRTGAGGMDNVGPEQAVLSLPPAAGSTPSSLSSSSSPPSGAGGGVSAVPGSGDEPPVVDIHHLLRLNVGHKDGIFKLQVKDVTRLSDTTTSTRTVPGGQVIGSVFLHIAAAKDGTTLFWALADGKDRPVAKRWRPAEWPWRVTLPLEGVHGSSARITLALSADPWLYSPLMPSMAWSSSGPRSIVLQIMEARGLVGRDWGGTADAFVRVTYDGRPYRTKTIWATTRPVWQQALVIQENASPMARNLKLEVVDAASAVTPLEYLLGTTSLCLDSAPPMEFALQDRWLPLAGADGGDLRVRLAVVPGSKDSPAVKQLVAALYNNQMLTASTPSLQVVVLRARNLMPRPGVATLLGLRDAYCNITFGGARQTTTIVKQSQNPQWEYTALFALEAANEATAAALTSASPPSYSSSWSTTSASTSAAAVGAGTGRDGTQASAQPATSSLSPSSPARASLPAAKAVEAGTAAAAAASDSSSGSSSATPAAASGATPQPASAAAAPGSSQMSTLSLNSLRGPSASSAPAGATSPGSGCAGTNRSPPPKFTVTSLPSLSISSVDNSSYPEGSFFTTTTAPPQQQPPASPSPSSTPSQPKGYAGTAAASRAGGEAGLRSFPLMDIDATGDAVPPPPLPPSPLEQQQQQTSGTARPAAATTVQGKGSTAPGASGLKGFMGWPGGGAASGSGGGAPRVLRLEVRDVDPVPPDDLLGWVDIDVMQYVPTPGSVFEQWFTLQKGMGGEILVRISHVAPTVVSEGTIQLPNPARSVGGVLSASDISPPPPHAANVALGPLGVDAAALVGSAAAAAQLASSGVEAVAANADVVPKDVLADISVQLRTNLQQATDGIEELRAKVGQEVIPKFTHWFDGAWKRTSAGGSTSTTSSTAGNTGATTSSGGGSRAGASTGVGGLQAQLDSWLKAVPAWPSPSGKLQQQKQQKQQGKADAGGRGNSHPPSASSGAGATEANAAGSHEAPLGQSEDGTEGPQPDQQVLPAVTFSFPNPLAEVMGTGAKGSKAKAVKDAQASSSSSGSGRDDAGNGGSRAAKQGGAKAVEPASKPVPDTQ